MATAALRVVTGQARRAAAAGTALVLPRPCLACQHPAQRTLGLCPTCTGALEAPPRTGARGDRLAGADRFFWLWAYQPPFDAVILGLKYRRLDYLGRHIAHEAAGRLGIELRRAEVVLPMPMHWRRRMKRGRNHAESIARPLADCLDRPLSFALRRRTPGRPQVGRGRRQRLRNPGLTFACRKPADVRRRTILLVDDVVTTGATAGRAARVLKRSGAREVIVFAAARTPP